MLQEVHTRHRDDTKNRKSKRDIEKTLQYQPGKNHHRGGQLRIPFRTYLTPSDAAKGCRPSLPFPSRATAVCIPL